MIWSKVQMNRVPAFLAVLGSVGIVLSMIIAVPVSAADRTITVGPVHEVGSAELADCGSFTVIVDYDFTFRLRLFFDKEGELTQIVEHVEGVDTFRNSETGATLSGPFHNSVLIDPEADIGANNGIIFKVTVPGSGAVFLDVGRLVADRQGNIYFQAGRHQFIDGDLTGLCEALSS